MKHFFNFPTKSLLASLAVCLCVSCADTWGDHYSVDPSVVPDKSITDRLEANPETSEFVKVLKSTKVYNGKKVVDAVTYFDLLSADQFFTVWAPVNSSMSADEWAKWSKENKTKAENLEASTDFIMNHVARFSHPAGKTERVAMMSGKRYMSTAEKIGTVSYSDKNLACNNGVLHIVQSYIPYCKSIYEYITTDPQYADNLGEFFKSYTIDEIDEEKSVPEGIKNGKVVYVDSVMIEKSVLMDRFGYINEEDSNYCVVLPTGAAYKQAYQDILPYFNYQSVEGADSLQRFWANSALLTDCFFNMNIQQYEQEYVTSTVYNDNEYKQTLKRYHYYPMPYNAGGVFKKDVVEEIECSNGKIYLTSQWSFDPKFTWKAPYIKEAENTSGRLAGQLASVTPVTVRGYDISREQILVIKGANATTDRWDVTFGMYDNLSGYYNFYAVIAPNSLTGETKTPKPNKFTTTITYFDENGRIQKYSPVNERKRPLDYFNDVNRIDTVLLTPDSAIYIPACNFAQKEPTVKVNLSITMLTNETKKYSNTMYLDCIIAEPADAPVPSEE